MRHPLGTDSREADDLQLRPLPLRRPPWRVAWLRVGALAANGAVWLAVAVCVTTCARL
jgi:hypothetical protein